MRSVARVGSIFGAGEGGRRRNRSFRKFPEMFLDHARFYPKVTGQVDRIGRARNLIAEILNRRHQGLKRVNAPLRLAHVELRPRPVGQPVKIRLRSRDSLSVCFRAVLLAVFVGIEPALELHNAHFHALVEKQFDRTLTRLRARRIRIEIQMQVERVPLHGPDLFHRKRRAARCNHLRHARLRRPDHIHVSLDENDPVELHRRIFGAVKVIQNVRLPVDFRFRRIEIFRLVLRIERAPAEGNHLTRFILDRKHQPVAEAIVE